MGKTERLYMLSNNAWIRYVTEFIKRDFRSLASVDINRRDAPESKRLYKD